MIWNLSKVVSLGHDFYPGSTNVWVECLSALLDWLVEGGCRLVSWLNHKLNGILSWKLEAGLKLQPFQTSWWNISHKTCKWKPVKKIYNMNIDEVFPSLPHFQLPNISRISRRPTSPTAEAQTAASGGSSSRSSTKQHTYHLSLPSVLLEPPMILVLEVHHPKRGLNSNQNKGHLGSRFLFCIFLWRFCFK